MPTIRIIVPSFNRPCQLECLLRSLFEQCRNAKDFSICAFFRYTDASFLKGYQLVMKLFPSVEFVEQALDRSFKTQFLELDNDSDFTGIIVDDMVVLDGFDPSDRPFELLQSREDIFSLSLRLDSAKTFSQPINEGAKSPTFDQDFVWRWKPRLPRKYRICRGIEKALFKSAFYDWEVPWALDGTFYRTSLYRKFFESIDEFSNIPFIEKSLSQAILRWKSAPPNMIRYPRSRSISLAMNSVDEHHDYPSLGLDPKQFNERFLAGGRLDYTPFQKIVFHACHVVAEPFWLPTGNTKGVALNA